MHRLAEAALPVLDNVITQNQGPANESSIFSARRTGLEPALGRTIQHQNGSIRVRRDSRIATKSDELSQPHTPRVTERDSTGGSRSAWEQALAWSLRARADELAAASPALFDAVSVALAEGLERARQARDRSTVAALAEALRDRQRALTGVVSLEAVRRRRRGP